MGQDSMVLPRGVVEYGRAWPENHLSKYGMAHKQSEVQPVKVYASHRVCWSARQHVE